jgi:ribosomal protein L22
MDIDHLQVDLVLFVMALFAKRVMPRARGRAARVEKKYSKLSIFLHEVPRVQKATSKTSSINQGA